MLIIRSWPIRLQNRALKTHCLYAPLPKGFSYLLFKTVQLNIFISFCYVSLSYLVAATSTVHNFGTYWVCLPTGRFRCWSYVICCYVVNHETWENRDKWIYIYIYIINIIYISIVDGHGSLNVNYKFYWGFLFCFSWNLLYKVRVANCIAK